jgi:hypothetical protein
MHDAEIVRLPGVPQFLDRTIAARLAIDQATAHMCLAVAQHVKEWASLPIFPILIIVSDRLKFGLPEIREIVLPNQSSSFVERVQCVDDDQTAADLAACRDASFSEAAH